MHGGHATDNYYEAYRVVFTARMALNERKKEKKRNIFQKIISQFTRQPLKIRNKKKQKSLIKILGSPVYIPYIPYKRMKIK